MRDANVFSLTRALPRMSWSPVNLYNLWRRSPDQPERVDFTRTTMTLFQQRWTAKKLLRAYHGDYINEKLFKRWYLPLNLPDVRPRRSFAEEDSLLLNKWANRKDVVEKDRKHREEEKTKPLPPVGSLMFSEVERRIDVLVFRSCFASSVYEARRLVIHGDVLLNGRKHNNPNTRLAPGDMVSVDPNAIRFIRPKSTAKDPIESEIGGETNKAHSQRRTRVPRFRLPSYASPFIFIPAYLEVSFATCSAIYLRHPTARPGYSEIPTPYDADGELVQLAWEWYAQVRPRIRSPKRLARMPDNRSRH